MVIMFPMTQVRLERDGLEAHIVYADSSKRVLGVIGDLPQSLVYKDAILSITRLQSAGWQELERGKVTHESL